MPLPHFSRDIIRTSHGRNILMACCDRCNWRCWVPNTAAGCRTLEIVQTAHRTLSVCPDASHLYPFPLPAPSVAA